MDFLHLPVPKDRTDDGYFAPLAELSLPPETTLYLGLIHHADAAGDRARIAAAHKVVPRFGVATRMRLGPHRSGARAGPVGGASPGVVA